MADVLYDVYDACCPTRVVLDRIADRWTALVVGRLAAGPQRFGALQRDVGGISPKMLSQTLRGLERDGVVSRTLYAQIPPRTEYALTPLGETLAAPLAAVRHWAEQHVQDVLSARKAFDASTEDKVPWQSPRPVPRPV